jgi:succinate dehydrogenase/fumarate reductase flavoprotein subunit
MGSQKASDRTKKPEGTSGISRREFLGTVAGGSAAFAVGSLLSGCAGGPSATQANPVSTATPSKSTSSSVSRPFQVHEADVLIIGGGLAGLMAAKKAMSDGATVMIVDKGPFGHSGTSGINWGHDMETNEWAEDDGSGSLGPIVFMNDGVVDQDYELSLAQHVHEARLVATNAQMGCIEERDKNGDPVSKNTPGPLVVDHGCFPRMFAQYARRSGAAIFDRTMVVDLLLSEKGEAAGAVAINLVDGESHVFRAKAVIMASGSYVWCYGWAGNGPYTIAGPENTGDGQSMFLKLGLEMRDMEQMPFDMLQIYPKGIAYGMGTMGLSIVNHTFATNKNGDRFTQILDDGTKGSNALFMRLTMKEINEGRALDNGCVYVDTTTLDQQDRYYRHVKPAELRGLGYTLPDKCEVHWELWETAARPASLGKTSESSVPGLFFAGTGTEAYTGMGFWGSAGSGYMSGKFATQVAKGKDLPDIVWSKVNDILNTAYGALESSPANSIRPLVVYHKLQQAMFDGLSPLRNEKGIQGTIDKLNKIQKEDFPLIAVTSKSRRYNLEWRNAMEIPNMWNCIMGTAQAALVRKETRGAHCRTDFPKMDNTNWLKNTIVTLKDGQWAADTRPIVATVIPMDQVAKMVPEIGID